MAKIAASLLIAALLLPRTSGAREKRRPVPDPPGFDRSFVEDSLGPDVVGNAVPGPRITDPRDFFVLKPGEWTYRLLGEDRPRAVEVEELNRLSRRSAHASWSRRIGNRAVTYLNVGRDGSIRQVCQADTKEAVMSRFSPSEWALLSESSPGDSKKLEIGVSVADITAPGTVKYRGALELTYTYVGAFELDVPSGRCQAILITEEYTGNVGPARIEDRHYAFYAKGIGKVAAIEQQSISAFLFYRENTRCGKVLLKWDDSPPQPIGSHGRERGSGGSRPKAS